MPQGPKAGQDGALDRGSSDPDGCDAGVLAYRRFMCHPGCCILLPGLSFRAYFGGPQLDAPAYNAAYSHSRPTLVTVPHYPLNSACGQ